MLPNFEETMSESFAGVFADAGAIWLRYFNFAFLVFQFVGLGVRGKGRRFIFLLHDFILNYYGRSINKCIQEYISLNCLHTFLL